MGSQEFRFIKLVILLGEKMQARLMLNERQSKEELQNTISSRWKGIVQVNASTEVNMIDLWKEFIENLMDDQNMPVLLKITDNSFFVNVFEGLVRIGSSNIDHGKMYESIGLFYRNYSVSQAGHKKRFFLKQAAKYYNLFLNHEPLCLTSGEVKSRSSGIPVVFSNKEQAKPGEFEGKVGNSWSSSESIAEGEEAEPRQFRKSLKIMLREIYCEYRSTYSIEQENNFCVDSFREELQQIRIELKEKLESLIEEKDIKKIRSDYNEKIKIFHVKIIEAAAVCYDRTSQVYNHHFELLSLGSVAQNYATAYSDLEIAILLDKKFTIGTCDNKRPEEIEQFIDFLEFHYTIIGEEVESHTDGFRITGVTLDAVNLEKILNSKNPDMLFVNFPEDLADYWINSIFKETNEACHSADQLVILRASPLFSTKKDSTLYSDHQAEKCNLWEKNTKDSARLDCFLSKWTQEFFNYMTNCKTEIERLKDSELIDFKVCIFQPIILWIMYVSFLLGYTYFSTEKPPTIDHIIDFIDSKKIFSSNFLDILREIVEKIWFLKCFWELNGKFKIVKRNNEGVRFSICAKTIQDSKNKVGLEGRITKDIFEIQADFILLLISSAEAIKNFFIEQKLPEEESVQKIFDDKLIKVQKILTECTLDKNEFSKKIINQIINIDKLLIFFPKKTEQELLDSVPPVFISTYSKMSNLNFLEKYGCDYEYYKNFVNLESIKVEDENPQWVENWFLVKKNNEEEMLWGILGLENIFRCLSIKSSADTVEPYFGFTDIYENKVICLFFVGSQADFDKFISIKDRDSKDIFVKKIHFYEKLFSIKLIDFNQKNSYKESFFKVFQELNDSFYDETRNRGDSGYLEKLISSVPLFIYAEREMDTKPEPSTPKNKIFREFSRRLSYASTSNNSTTNSYPSTPRSSFSQEEKEIVSSPGKDGFFYNYTNNEVKAILKSKNKEERYEYIISTSTYSGWTLFHFLLNSGCSTYLDILSFFSFFNEDDVFKILCKKTVYGYTPLHYLMLNKYPVDDNKNILSLVLYYFCKESFHELSDQISIFSHTPLHFFLSNKKNQWTNDNFKLILSFIDKKDLYHFFWMLKYCLLPSFCLVLEKCTEFSLILYIFKEINKINKEKNDKDLNEEVILYNSQKYNIFDFLINNKNISDDQKEIIKTKNFSLEEENIKAFQCELEEINKNYNKGRLEIVLSIFLEKVKERVSELEIKEDIKKIPTNLFINIEDRPEFFNIFSRIFFLMIENYREDIVLALLNILPLHEYKFLLVTLKEENTAKDALYFSAKKESGLFVIFMSIILEEKDTEEKEIFISNCMQNAVSCFLESQKENIIEYFFNFIKKIEKKDDRCRVKFMVEKAAEELLNEEKKQLITRKINSVLIEDSIKSIKNKKNNLMESLENKNKFINQLLRLKDELSDLNKKELVNQKILKILEEKISKVGDSVKETKELVQKYGGSWPPSSTLFNQATCSVQTDANLSNK